MCRWWWSSAFECLSRYCVHGPTDWNAAGRIQGHTDIPLSDAGLAKMAALRLPLRDHARLCQPMLRARQTAEALGLAEPSMTRG